MSEFPYSDLNTPALHIISQGKFPEVETDHK